MKYIHIRNLEKYHPSYKDRKLQWAKIYFDMAQGDPDCEMITNEIDWGRLIRLILLELQAQKPIPIDENYLIKKGFDLRKHKIELTIQSLQKFLEVRNETVTEDLKVCDETVTKIREEKEKSKIRKEWFLEFWKIYPKKKARKKAEDSWEKIDFNKVSLEVIIKAVSNQCRSKEWLKDNGQYIPYPATWLNNMRWEDVLEVEEKRSSEKPIREGYCTCGGKFEINNDDGERYCNNCIKKEIKVSLKQIV